MWSSSLSVIQANVWMKPFETSLKQPEHSESISKSDQNRRNKNCKWRKNFRGKRVEGESRKKCSMQECKYEKTKEITTFRMLFAFVSIASIGRQRGMLRRKDRANGLRMTLSAHFVVNRIYTKKNFKFTTKTSNLQ